MFSLKYSFALIFTLPIVLMGCAAAESQTTDQPQTQSQPEILAVEQSADKPLDSLIVAGGCFWCVESDFEKHPGVIEAVSGYTGGRTENPTYKQVTYNETGHYEAAKITFDPSLVSYEELLSFYWTTIDPTDDKGQFCDKGTSYRTAIFARPDQMDAAQASLMQIKNTKPFANPIVTPVLPAAKFYDAEDYHQDYYKKNPIRYRLYRTGCGRDARLKQLWGKDAKG